MKTKAFTSPSLAAVVADVLLVGVFEGENFDGANGNSFAKSANLLTEGSLARKAESVGFKGAVGETMEHFTDGKTAAKQILVFGLGARDKAD